MDWRFVRCFWLLFERKSIFIILDNLDTWKPYGWHVFTYKKGVLYCNYVFYYHTNEYLRIYKMDAMKIDFLNI